MNTLIKLFVSTLLICFFAVIAQAFDITLAWDPNEPAPDGYLIYQRLEGQAYDYDEPIWMGTETTLDVNNLDDNATYCFVARAYVGDAQSVDSNEVCADKTTTSGGGSGGGGSGGGGGCFIRTITK